MHFKLEGAKLPSVFDADRAKLLISSFTGSFVPRREKGVVRDSKPRLVIHGHVHEKHGMTTSNDTTVVERNDRGFKYSHQQRASCPFVLDEKKKGVSLNEDASNLMSLL